MNDYRHRIKERSVYVMGDSCQCCGYNRCLRALQFHHIDETTKEFQISDNITRNWADVRSELTKCILVCANCHQEIHGGIIDCPTHTSFNEARAKEIDNLVAINKKKEYICSECGASVYANNTLCITCAGKRRRKVQRPNREELKLLLQQYHFTEIGKMYNLTEAAIRKWCKDANLPYRIKDIKCMSIADWENC